MEKAGRVGHRPATPPPPSQTPDRPTVSGLTAFEKNRSRKRQASSGLNDRPASTPAAQPGTPRSQRFKNIFKEANPTLLDISRKLYELIEGSILLPKKGGEKISSLGSETAADIKTLAASVLDLVERSNNIPSLTRNLLSEEDDDHRFERALAGANAFGCKVPDLVESRLDSIDKTLAEIKKAFTAPSGGFTFTTPTLSTPHTNRTAGPSYALAASKHAPRANANTSGPTFRPVPSRTQPPPPPKPARAQNAVKLAQTVEQGTELATLSYPALILKINNILATNKIKETPSDTRPIQVRSVHRHPSNDLVLYTTNAEQAKELRKQGDAWLPHLSLKLTLRPPIFTVVVHGIPTSFNPTSPDHLDMLTAMNPDTFSTPPVFVKWISPQAVQRGVSHSSIRIGLASATQATLAVKNKIFYGSYNKKTEHGRVTKTRCMNCLQEGHTSHHCKAAVMCPYCADAHHADTCSFRGKTTSNCTACARKMKTTDPSVDLQTVFSTTPVALRHSPLDPTCPARIALGVERAKKAAELRQRQPGASEASATEQTRAPDAANAAGGDADNIDMVVAQ